MQAARLAPHLTGKRVPLSSVPVVDFAPFRDGTAEDRARVAGEIAHACRQIGFFYLVNHGVPQALVDRVLANARAFFALPAAEKEQLHIRNTRFHRGYIGIADEGLTKSGDLKEAFDMALDLPLGDPDVLAGKPFHGPNVYPADPPDFEPCMRAYYADMLALAGLLCRAFAIGLGLPEHFFSNRIDKPLAQLRVLRYPPQGGTIASGEWIGIAEHSDYGLVSILSQDAVGGLQLRNAAGEWIAAPPIPGSFTCNLGDAMARWTNDLWPATPHRVINSAGRDRYSTVLFFDPNYDCVIEPLANCIGPDRTPHYAPITMGQHLANRFDDSFKYRGAHAKA
ncbi:MAG TPA: 2-oxoglutarate and iron-dependent oxygenase domain-containing protein [Dongiaceae bacterium]|nr:2-oxoglutarate and iron-dependent oxygenase domain-containing protein [Dongiaceae bacterium]